MIPFDPGRFIPAGSQPYHLFFADDLVGSVANEGRVTSAPNRGTCGVPATHPTGGPKLLHAGMNGYPAFDFTTNTTPVEYLNIDTTLVDLKAQPLTFLVVVDLDVITGRVFSNSNSTSDRILLNPGSSSWRLFAGASVTTHSSAAPLAEVNVIAAVANGASSRMLLNGAWDNPFSAGTNSFRGLTIGANYDQTSSMDGRISFFAMWDGDVTGEAWFKELHQALMNRYRNTPRGPEGEVAFPTDSPLGAISPILWLDAADPRSFSYSAGRNVSQWRDRSPSGWHMNNYGAGTPERKVARNGLPVVEFVAADSECMHAGDVNDLQSNNDKTLFIVSNSKEATNSAIYGKSVFAGTNGRWHFAELTNSIGFTMDPGSGISTAAVSMTYADEWSIWEVTFDLSDSHRATLFRNGTQLASDTRVESTGSLNTEGFLWLGAYGTASGQAPQSGYFFDGQIAEVIDFGTILSAGDRAAVRNYLSRKWRIPVS